MSSIPSTAIVVVFGSTGPVGTALIEQLSNEHPSWTIRAVTRDATKAAATSELKKLPNVEFVQGDPLNPQDVETVSKDSDIMYCCVGFAKYERKYWAKNWPIVARNLLSAVTAGNGTKKRRLVFCDNLYAYGPGTNRSPTIEPVQAGLNSKPGVRATLRNMFKDHMKAHPGTLTVVGGSDFYGPNVTSNSMLGDMFTGKIVDSALSVSKNGKPTAMILGSCDKIHDCCYALDFANALAVASVNDEAYDAFWICPHSIRNKTFREIANDIADVAYGGSPHEPVKMTVIATVLMYLLAPVMPFLGEMIEMKNFYQKDYTVDDSDFCTKFGVKATPYKETLSAYVDFYRTEKHSVTL